VVIEATYGWYWVVDLLADNGARVHLANPQALNWGQRRVKNDERVRSIWRTRCVSVACRRRGSHRRPPGSCEVVRYRARLVGLRSGLKAQVHAVMAPRPASCRR
jgi:hypothetical protein